MITLKEFFELIDYRVTEGWQFQWSCFGDNAYGLDHYDEDKQRDISIVFDTKTHIVYVAYACFFDNDKAYRLINPEYRSVYEGEHVTRSDDKKFDISFNCAWDDVNYEDFTTAEEFIEVVKQFL